MPLLETITILLIFLSFLFAIFLIGVPSKNTLGNRILATFLIIRAVDASSMFHYRFNIHPVVDQLRHDLGAFLQEPLLFLFILSIVYSDFKFQKRHMYHLIPLVLSLMVWMPEFYLPYLEFGDLAGKNDFYFESRFTYILGAIQKLFYIIITYLIIFRYQKIYVQNFSSTKPFNYQWLLMVNHMSVALFFIASIKNIVKFSDWDEYLGPMRIFTMLVMLFFISWLVLKALYAPQLFSGIGSSLKLITKSNPNIKKNESLSPEIEQQILSLKAHLQKHESFLNPDLTIGDLAKEMGMEARELSLLINKSMGQNFYKLMIDYRIEKAKSIFSDPSKNHLSVLEVLYSVGYNSKSSFNQAFKKNTGFTPTEFRRRQLKHNKI